MTTPPREEAEPRGEADEPAPIRETGVGWPDQPSPPRPRQEPKPPPAPAAKPQPPPPPPATDNTATAATAELPRQAPAAPPGAEFATAVRQYRAGSSSYVRSAHSYQVFPDRPGNVTAAAVILFVGAGLGLLACCGINLLAGNASLGDDEQNVLLIFSAVLVVTSLLNILLGYFILQGRQWARVTTIVFSVLGIAASAVALFIGASSEDAGSNALSTCVGLVLNIVVIALLSGERASHYFRYARG